MADAALEVVIAILSLLLGAGVSLLLGLDVWAMDFEILLLIGCGIVTAAIVVVHLVIKGIKSRKTTRHADAATEENL